MPRTDRDLVDFEQYLETEHAQRAAVWQLQSLVSMRRAAGKPLSMELYQTLQDGLRDAARAGADQRSGTFTRV